MNKLTTTLCSVLLLSSLAYAKPLIGSENKQKIEHVQKDNLENLIQKHSKAKKVYEKSSLSFINDETVDIPFNFVTDLILNYELSYKLADLLTGSGYKIKKVSNSMYNITANDGETSKMEILHQKQSKPNFKAIYYITGRRSFGPFKAVIYLDYTKLKDNKSHYHTEVYVSPRGFFTKLGLFIGKRISYLNKKIDAYFREETKFTLDASTRTFEQALKDPQDVIRKMKKDKRFTKKETYHMINTYKNSGIDIK
tara:strand:+ start:2146 stop:2904 length:759 start_codon:yes stop_codon:yes gene_type:complete